MRRLKSARPNAAGPLGLGEPVRAGRTLVPDVLLSPADLSNPEPVATREPLGRVDLEPRTRWPSRIRRASVRAGKSAVVGSSRRGVEPVARLAAGARRSRGRGARVRRGLRRRHSRPSCCRRRPCAATGERRAAPTAAAPPVAREPESGRNRVAASAAQRPRQDTTPVAAPAGPRRRSRRSLPDACWCVRRRPARACSSTATAAARRRPRSATSRAARTRCASCAKATRPSSAGS